MMMFDTMKDDVTRNRLPELSDAIKGKMQRRIGCSEKDMDFYFIALALQCTRIYVKYHMDDLDEMKDCCAADPIIGLPFGVVAQLVQTEDMKEAFIQVTRMVYDDMPLVAEAIVRQLNAIGSQAYAKYGLSIEENKFIVDDTKMAELIEFLSVWSLNRTKRKEDLGTLFDLVVCIFYYLLQDESHRNHDMDANMIMMYSNSVASFSDCFWTGSHTEYGRMEGILNMSVNGFAENLDRVFYDELFMREILVEYIYITERGHEGNLL